MESDKLYRVQKEDLPKVEKMLILKWEIHYHLKKFQKEQLYTMLN